MYKKVKKYMLSKYFLLKQFEKPHVLFSLSGIRRISQTLNVPIPCDLILILFLKSLSTLSSPILTEM